MWNDRHRSRKVELESRVYDHVAHRFRWGFRLLTLGWSDGTTFLPITLALLSSASAKQRRQPETPRVDHRTHGGKRRREAIQPAPRVVLSLLHQALRAGLTARYVLFDRWFSMPRLLGEIVTQTGLDVIAMVKAPPIVRYRYHGQLYTLKQLFRRCRATWSRSTVLGSLRGPLPTSSGDVPVTLVFVRDRRGGSKKWLAILSTDSTLPDDEVVRTYGKRWDIEVFFKTAKSLLGLPREYHGRSYDGLVAHTTLVFIRYQFLAAEARQSQDLRTVGALFWTQCQELADLAFARVWEIILEAFQDCLQDDLELSPAQVDAAFERFLTRIPVALRARFHRNGSTPLNKSA